MSLLLQKLLRCISTTQVKKSFSFAIPISFHLFQTVYCQKHKRATAFCSKCVKHYNFKEIPLVAKYSLAFTNTTNISPYRESTATNTHKPTHSFLNIANVLNMTTVYFQNCCTACRHSYSLTSACGLCVCSGQLVNVLTACFIAVQTYKL